MRTVERFGFNQSVGLDGKRCDTSLWEVEAARSEALGSLGYTVNSSQLGPHEILSPNKQTTILLVPETNALNKKY